MKVVVALLTYNRLDLFSQTIASLRRTNVSFELLPVDNGSTDGTAERVRELGGICDGAENHTIGHGFRIAVTAALERDPDLLVFSGDDYEYHDGWLERLLAFWNDPPADVDICGCHLEPVYGWNKPLGTVESGGQRALVRATVEGASWTFLPSLWNRIEQWIPDHSHHYDKRICRELRQAGRRICVLPVAEHIGDGRRVWSDKRRPRGQSVDREKWGI